MADKLGVAATDLIQQALAMDLPQPALTSATRHSMTLSHHASSSLLASHQTLSSAHSRRLSLSHSAPMHAASAHAAYTPAASAHGAPSSPAITPLGAHASYSLREGRGGRPGGAGGGAAVGGVGGGGMAGDIVPPGDDFPPRLRLIRTRSVEAQEQAETDSQACRPEPLGELTSSLSAHNSHEGMGMGGEEKGGRWAEGQQAWVDGAGRGTGGRNENVQGGGAYAPSLAGAGARDGEALERFYAREEVAGRGGPVQMAAAVDAHGAMVRVMASAVAAAAEELRQGSRAQAGGEMGRTAGSGAGRGTQQYDNGESSSVSEQASSCDPAAAAAEDAVASLMFFDAFRFFSLPHFARHHFVPLAQCGRQQLQGLPPPRMDSIRYIKMCKETGILDARFTTTSADIIFSKVTRGSERKLSVYALTTALHLIAQEKGQPVESLQRTIIAHFHAHVPAAELPPPGSNPASSSPGASSDASSQHNRQLAWMQHSAQRPPMPSAGCWASPSPAHSAGCSSASTQHAGASHYARMLHLQQQGYEAGDGAGYGRHGLEEQGSEGKGRSCPRSQSPQAQRRHSICAMTACYELPHHRQHGGSRRRRA
ncbi:hypothetical protein CLOM_g23363 [Closterium sp. NIES-68]|nr:hypothetical protein CLOM_g23363 [Closterium sp. NIES-68]